MGLAMDKRCRCRPHRTRIWLVGVLCSRPRTYARIRHDAQLLSGIEVANVEQAFNLACTALQQGNLVVLTHALERMNILHCHDDSLDGVLETLQPLCHVGDELFILPVALHGAAQRPQVLVHFLQSILL